MSRAVLGAAAGAAGIILLCALQRSWALTSQTAAPASPPADKSSNASAGTTVSTSPVASPIDAAISRGIEHLLAAQEGDGQAEWPYEGVYRERGQIPIGYRVGGTGICVMALVEAPGYSNDAARQQAVYRALEFVIRAADDPKMSPEYDGGYDVRGWGYIYGLSMLVKLKSSSNVPADLNEAVDALIQRDVRNIQQIEIPQVGGWTYSRAPGMANVSPPSPFMTAPSVLALMAARDLGFHVDPLVIERGLQALEKARTATGSVVYSGIRGATSTEPVPGAVGRMLAAETTLYRAGRSTQANVRGALDAFIVHWEWLNKRRAQDGTHQPPYSIAPYYFFYAHYFAARAIELLPQRERAEYRRRVNDLLFSVRNPDGTWNDRVFKRSSSYGTAMAMLALMMPQVADREAQVSPAQPTPAQGKPPVTGEAAH